VQTHLVLTVIGPDRPGLIRAVAAEIAAADGSWLESRMASLAGQFAGIVLATAPQTKVDVVIERLNALASQGLRLTIERGSDEPAPRAERSLRLELLGQDRPGIVRDIAAVLAERRISVDELETETLSGSFSGETLFKATARLRVPAAVATATLRAALEDLANELMVDISLEDSDPAAATASN
jgi:glycine cleavage system regulatory protein